MGPPHFAIDNKRLTESVILLENPQNPEIVWTPAMIWGAQGYDLPPQLGAIDYIDRTPKAIEVQVELVDYFERIKRVKADTWQKHFCSYLQNAVVNRHIKPIWAEFHAQAQMGKTSILSQAFSAWCMGHDPLWQTALAMFNISRAEAHSQVVIQLMQSPVHQAMFPNKDGWLTDTVSKSSWMTNARRELNDGQPSFNPVGLQSGMTGTSFDSLIIDDPYKEPKDAFSETVYENMERFWLYGVDPRLKAHSLVFAMFHRYSYDDFGGYLLNTGKFDYVRYSSIADGPYLHDETGQKFEDPLGRANGELICPERFPHSYYEGKQSDDKVWLSMFQGRPGRDEGDFFKVDRIGDATEADWQAAKVRARGWDHAATQGRGDNSAGALGGIQPDSTCIFDDVFSDQLDSARRVEKQAEIAKADGPDVTVVVPEGIGADGKDNVFLMQQNLREFNVVGRKVTNASPGSDAKKRRAYNLSIAVNSGKVKFTPGPWVDRVKRLMRRFGSSLSGDDEIDAMADTYNYLIEQFYKGLVLKGVPKYQLWSAFAQKFGNKVPAHWTVYAAVTITPEANMPNSAVIVTRAAQNSGLVDNLFVLGEYKAYTADFNAAFTWVDDTLAKRCADTAIALLWLNEEAEYLRPTLQQKTKRAVQIFKEDVFAGVTELNWYTQAGKILGLIADPQQLGLATDAKGLYSLRQEAATWGYNAKGEPSAVGAVLNCLRMIAYRFRTTATELTPDEKVEEAMPQEYKIANMLKKSPHKHGLTDGQELARTVMETEVRERLGIKRDIPDWMDGGVADEPTLGDGW